MSDLRMTERAKMLFDNDLDWYVCTLENGDYELVHATGLSSILEAGQPPEESGYTNIERCWNGEDLTTEDDWV